MNSPNAFGFLVLGALMHVAPDIAPSMVNHAATVAASSTAAIWMEFMSYVIAGIGGGHFVHQGASRLSVLVTAVLPLVPRAVEPLGAKPVPARVPSGAQA